MEQKNNSNSEAIIALVCGIVSVVFAFLGLWLNIIALICAIVALVFAIKARKKAEKRGMSTAGLVLGIIGCSLCPIFLACNICVYSAAKEVKNNWTDWTEFSQKINDTLNSEEVQDTLKDTAENFYETVNDVADKVKADDATDNEEDLYNNTNEQIFEN